jgi:hypothetical protein
MKTIQRLYIYAVALVSLEVVIWGLIGLARSAFAGDEIGGDVARLASALALIFVGIPVFLLHWWLAQRNARKNEDDRSSYVRALFLYGVLLVTLIPVAQNTLTILNRLFFSLFDLSRDRAMFGYGQTLSDNLIAMVMNGLIAAYIFSVLRKDWSNEPVGNPLAETRRFYLYIWLIYGLVMMAIGIQQSLLYIFDAIGDTLNASQSILANGLTLTLVGTPIWAFSWRIVQKRLDTPQEQESLMRTIILSVVHFTAQILTLFAAGMILEVILYDLPGGNFFFTRFIDDIRDPISLLIPFGIVWGYYRTILSGSPNTEQQASVRRLFTYTISLIGLIVAFIGLLQFLAHIIDVLVHQNTWDEIYLGDLSIPITLLIIGLPLWLSNWRRVNKPFKPEGDEGDQAWRSMIRKIYLYLVLFMGVMGVMISTGTLIFQLLQALLGDPDSELLQISLDLISMLVLFSLVIWYHGVVLRSDGRLLNQARVERQTEFPILVLASELGPFSEMLVAALSKEAPTMPVAVHVVEQGVPDDSLSDARAVILSANIMASPGEAIRLWLQNFAGMRFVIPTPVERWIWVSRNDNSMQNLVQRTAEMVSRLAEGEDISQTRPASPWLIFGYIIGGIGGVIFLLIAASILIDVLN